MRSHSGYPAPVRTAMRRSQRLLSARLFGVTAWLVWLLAYPLPAFAQRAAAADFTFGVGECPSPKAVRRAILELIPADRHGLLGGGVRVEIGDLGENYRVAVWKQGVSVEKIYSDPARDCGGRVRFAAVFAVLTLMPPELGIEPAMPAPKPAAPRSKSNPVPRAPPAPKAWQSVPLASVELGILYASAPAILEAPNLQTIGGELRVALGRGALTATLSVAYLRPAKFDLRGVEGELTRLPVSVGLRLASRHGSSSVAGDLALLAVAQRLRATNLLSSGTAGSLDVGLRAGVSLSHDLGATLSPFVGAFAWISPGPGEIAALPPGKLGNLPHLWLGLAAGLSLRL